MRADTIWVRAVPSWNLAALFDDPLVRIVMHVDGATSEDILAAVQIAYQAIVGGELAPESSSPR
jgi:hypothetical protein